MTVYKGTEKSDCKAFEVSAATLGAQISEMDDKKLSALGEQAQYGFRGELPYREWLRRTGYPDMQSARNAHERYQGIARFLAREHGAFCAILSDLTMQERRRRHAKRFSSYRR